MYKRLLYELGRVSERKIELLLPETETELSIWILGETAEIYTQYFQRLEGKYPQLSLHLTTFASEDVYFDELQKAFQRNSSPDIFLVNEEYFLKFKKNKNLLPAPNHIFSVKKIKKDFYPVSLRFTEEESVFAAPLFGNFVVMLSNSALLTDDRIFVANKPGNTWAELFQNFQKYKQFSDPKKILPISLGDAEFSSFTFEVFLSLLHQSRTQNFHQKSALDALSFLLSFAKDIPSSIQKRGEETAFLEGKIGVLFGNERTAARVKEKLRNNTNPKTNDLKERDFELHLLPQFNTQNAQTYGTIWGLGISEDTQHPEFAWSLVEILTFSPQKSKEHLLRTGETPLLLGVENGIFSQSALTAISGEEWQNIDFKDLFTQNILAHLEPPKKEEPRPLEDILNNFADFFSQNNAQESQ